MFDLRYHVASLAAVFLALVIGILVGVGISRSSFVTESERLNLEAEIARLRDDLDEARQEVREREAAEAFVDGSYAAVMNGRLADREIALVFIGSVDGRVQGNVEEALTAASGSSVRMRAIKVPLDVREVEAALPPNPTGPRFRGQDRLDDLGRVLGEELVVGGETPLWDALAELLVEQQSGGTQRPADGVVVVRSAPPQAADTARFLSGLYRGLASAGVPSVAVASSRGERPSLDVFEEAGFSTVNNVDTPAGRLSLAVLLAGDDTGQYGIDAEDGYLPRVPALPLARTTRD